MSRHWQEPDPHTYRAGPHSQRPSTHTRTAGDTPAQWAADTHRAIADAAHAQYPACAASGRPPSEPQLRLSTGRTSPPCLSFGSLSTGRAATLSATAPPQRAHPNVNLNQRSARLKDPMRPTRTPPRGMSCSLCSSSNPSWRGSLTFLNVSSPLGFTHPAVELAERGAMHLPTLPHNQG